MDTTDEFSARFGFSWESNTTYPNVYNVAISPSTDDQAKLPSDFRKQRGRTTREPIATMLISLLSARLRCVKSPIRTISVTHAMRELIKIVISTTNENRRPNKTANAPRNVCSPVHLQQAPIMTKELAFMTLDKSISAKATSRFPAILRLMGRLNIPAPRMFLHKLANDRDIEDIPMTALNEFGLLKVDGTHDESRF
jgi:hypothetical protein